MTLHSERHHTPETKINSSDRQNPVRANDEASPKPEHNENDNTFTEALASANTEKVERAKQSLRDFTKELFRRPFVRRTAAGVAIAAAVGSLAFIRSNGDKTETSPQPTISASATPGPNSSTTIETTSTTAPSKKEGPPSYAENSLRFKEAKQHTISPEKYVMLPPTGLSPKETSDDFFGRALNEAANSKTEDGQWRPELVDGLFAGDSKGLTDMHRTIYGLQQDYDDLKTKGQLEEGSFIFFRHTTEAVESSGIYNGADVIKERAFGYIVNPQGFVVSPAWPMDGKYIFDPQKHSTARFPDGTIKQGAILRNVWQTGDEIPS